MIWVPVIFQHEGTKGTKMYEAPPHPPTISSGGAASYSFVSFVPSC
jgi:hypothetical protein